MTEYKDFAINFHSRYTKSFMETLLQQVMMPVEGNTVAKERILELIKLSLSIIAYINRQNQEAAILLIDNRESMLRLCMEKFRTPTNTNYSSFN